MHWDCGRLGCPKGEALSFRESYSCLPLVCAPPPPLTKILFFLQAVFSVLISEALGGDPADFVVQFGMAHENANVLNVLAEAKNRDICQYNLV